MGEPIDLPKRPLPSSEEVTIDHDVFVDKDGNVVDAKDPAKVTKVVGAGGKISKVEAQKYSLSNKPTVAEETPSESAAKPVEVVEDKGKKSKK